jgi:hypothetical protein
MTVYTVADYLADRLAELSGDNVFGAPVDHRQDREQLEQLPTSLVGCFRVTCWRRMWERRAGDMIADGRSEHVYGFDDHPAQNLLREGVEWNTGRPSRSGSATPLGGLQPRKRVS